MDEIVQQAIEEADCPCDGGQPTLLGVLGNLVHLRCRNCGMDWSVDVRPQQESQDTQPQVQ